MKRFIVLFLILFCLQLEYAFSSFHLVRIFLNNEQDLIKLEKLSLDFESATKGKDFVDLVVNDYELTTLASSGLNFSVLFDDYEKYLSEQIQQENRKEPVEPLSFKLGSMGGFYKLNEIYERFDELAKNYPYFIQADTIGSSWEGRKIVSYAFGSNNTKSDEVLITALHHSREPATVTTIVYFLNTIFDLAKEGNPEAEYLLQNRSIWVIPVLNPDGYYYNETRYPNGGGMWRKNRRPINSTDTGVDLNRNYGPYEFWDANNNGSSTNPKNETYRGPEPFSEPELQALRSFCFQHKFEMALNFHTYGGMLIYPYSALPSETPDSVWYRSFGMYIQPLTSYYFGTDVQTVGYATRGSSDDWFYTPDSTKGKVLAFSPEASYQFDGFWPKQNRIIQIAKENFPLILNFLWSAGANIRLIDNYYFFDTLRKVGYLSLEFQNLGIKPNGSKDNVHIYSLLNEVSLDTTLFLPSLQPTEKYSITLSVPIPKPSFLNGSSVNFVVSISQDNVLRNDTISLVLYAYEIVDLKQPERWNFEGSQWGFEFDSTKEVYYLCDSPYRNYADSLDNYLYSKGSYRLNFKNAQLEIYSRWLIEPFYDYGLVEASTDYGNSWVSLRSYRSTIPSQNPYGKQKQGTFGFAGYFPYWNRQIFSLSQFLWKDVMFRLSLLSDRGKNLPGWDIEGIQLRVFPPVDFENYAKIENNSVGIPIRMKNLFIDAKDLSNFKWDRVRIFDCLGRLLFEITDAELPSFDFEILPPGLYIFAFENPQRTIVKKAIKI